LVSQSIISTTPNWSILIDEINSRTVDGIIISNFIAPSVNDIISISGMASNRDTLNQFKKKLQDSPYLTSVEMPITNLEQKGDIPFSVTFRIKDPSMLYYK
jgi:Tfp pilus assembly protein PilN